MFRPETLVINVTKTVPAANTDFDMIYPRLPAGTYRMAMNVKSSVTGTTTTVVVTPFVDHDASQLNSLALQMYELDDIAAITTLTLTAGAAGRYVRFGGAIGASDPSDMTVVLPHGVRVAVVKGGATTGETLEIQLTASRIS